MKIKPLEFIDEPGGYYIVSRTTAITDTWSEDTDHSHPRIYHRFDVFRDNSGQPCAMSSSLNQGPVKVKTFEEGKRLCEEWHQTYWNQLLQDIKNNILESED